MAHKTITIILLAAALSMFGLGAAFAQDLKIGYIDSQRIFAEYRETQEAERLYKQEVEAWKAQAAAMEQELVRMQDELRAQSLMLSAEKQREKKLDYDRKLEEYQRFMADTFGETGIAARRNQEFHRFGMAPFGRSYQGGIAEFFLRVYNVVFPRQKKV